jgi:dephospho-CoA kinase
MLPDDAVLVVEAIKLLESELRKASDQIWVVVAPHATIIERLASRGMSEREADLRLAQQPTEDRFRAAADSVIVNDGDRDRTSARVREAWAALGRARAGSSRGPRTSRPGRPT